MCGATPQIAIPAIPGAMWPPEIDGHDGIAITGREEAYATALWLEGPSAFWLHPEGPLSNTTPDEWREKQSRDVAERVALQRIAGMLNPPRSLASLPTKTVMTWRF